MQQITNNHSSKVTTSQNKVRNQYTNNISYIFITDEKISD